jgi:hypothetical protein
MMAHRVETQDPNVKGIPGSQFGSRKARCAGERRLALVADMFAVAAQSAKAADPVQWLSFTLPVFEFSGSSKRSKERWHLQYFPTGSVSGVWNFILVATLKMHFRKTLTCGAKLLIDGV